MKIFFKIVLFLLLTLIILLTYLSVVGVETDRFNSQIENKIKNIDEKIEIELKKIKLVLDPFKLNLNIKTIDSKLKNQNAIIEIERLNTQISLKSLVEKKFLIENLEISLKSLKIKNLISFIRSFQNTPQLFLLEKTVKKGYVIADIKLEFNSLGEIKDNYTINGYIKDTDLSVLKKYNLQKLNLIFEYKKDKLKLNDIVFNLNDLNFLSDNISVNKRKNDYFVKGNINHNKFNLTEKNLDLFAKKLLPKFEIKKFLFSSENTFSFEIDKGFQFNNFEINSDMLVNEFSFINVLDLKKFFPKIQEKISLSENKLSIRYKKNDLSVKGKGKLLYQDNFDDLIYTIKNKDKILNFETSLKINDNPFIIDFLNYKKNENNKTNINLKGSRNKNRKILIEKFDLFEDKNKITISNLTLNKNFQIMLLDKVHLDYTDQDKQKNSIKFEKKKDQYYLIGSLFNANNLIDNLLSDDESSNFLDMDSKVNVNIDKILLDNEHYVLDFSGDILFKNKEILYAKLNGDFPDNKKFKFTVNTNDNNKITTLYVDKAEPIVRKYKFIKGFDEGSLDYNSSKKFNESISQLKIYDFKLKELPVLTKILTLASLQGIADILSGEGIRFDEFEMNFKNKGNLMTIDEIYAIGPAISILMEGYVEKNQLISLRGTLVPATTINKFIGSIPVLGKILVGSKTGEGVFGVSFKIKGPPKKLETSVNPIKTLTPRFITRTLEKIKKN